MGVALRRGFCKTLRRFACVLGAVLVVGLGCYSQSFPVRPVTLIVPFPPGGAADLLARILTDELGRVWDEAVLIDYRPGAGTVLGTDVVARAKPDGYTLGMVVTSFVINPAVREDLPYSTSNDFRGVSQLGEAPIVLLASPSFSVTDVDELIARSRAMPSAIPYAVPGFGTVTHMAGELLARSAGIELLAVPYAGLAQALPDVLSGRVPLLFDVWYSAKPYVESGSLNVLAVATPGGVPDHPEFESLPNRFPGFSAVSMQGVVVPTGTPDELVQLIARDIRAVISSSAFAEAMDDFGMRAVGSSPDEFESFLQREIERWAKIAQDTGIRID